MITFPAPLSLLFIFTFSVVFIYFSMSVAGFTAQPNGMNLIRKHFTLGSVAFSASPCHAGSIAASYRKDHLQLWFLPLSFSFLKMGRSGMPVQSGSLGVPPVNITNSFSHHLLSLFLSKRRKTNGIDLNVTSLFNKRMCWGVLVSSSQLSLWLPISGLRGDKRESVVWWEYT